MTQILQGLNLPKIKGSLVKTDVDFLTHCKTLPISANETANVVSGAFVTLDLTVTTEDTIKLASATLPKDKVLFVPRLTMADDLAGTSQGSIDDTNGFFVKSKVTFDGANQNNNIFYAEAGDTIDRGDYVMIDDTDASRSTLITYAEATDPDPANYYIAKALETATASGQIIAFQFI